MGQKNRVLSVRLPPELQQKLDAVVQKTGNSQTEVLVYLLRKGLQKEAEGPKQLAEARKMATELCDLLWR